MPTIRRTRTVIARAALLSAVAALANTPAVARAQDVPSKLSDSTFWKMVTTMSEPDGQFRYENFLSNEIQYQYVIPALKAKSIDATTQPLP